MIVVAATMLGELKRRLWVSGRNVSSSSAIMGDVGHQKPLEGGIIWWIQSIQSSWKLLAATGYFSF